jgi:glycine/serine hydroxymethyltransferase
VVERNTMLREKIESVIDRAIDNNLWRQNKCFNLIPSETTPSLLVKLCEISDPAGRYAEHRTLKGKEIYFYQGTDFIRDVEEETRAALCEYFGCTRVELRPISGQMANEVVFKAMVKFLNRDAAPGVPFARMTAVMNNELNKGGHLSSQPMGALFNYVEIDPATGKERVVNFPVLKENLYRADVSKLEELMMAAKPELVVFGKSMFIYPEPVREVAQIAERMNPRPTLMYDMAHVLGLYGAFQEPLHEGADLVTGSTHKTFFGPQRGVVASSIDKGAPNAALWTEIKSRAFPGSTSNHHLGTLLGLLLAVHEMNAFKKEYQVQVMKNAKAFAGYLKKQGLDVEGNPADGYTQTHQVIVRVRKYGTGEEIAQRLEQNCIIVNYQALPDDESFINSSGIRTGVQEMTRFGMKETDFELLAGLMADVVIRDKSVLGTVENERAKFLNMRYCLPTEETLPLAAKVLVSLLHESDYAKEFADNLYSAAALLERNG